jgi:hypothetical protein
MDESLWDLLYEWAFTHCPALLDNPEGFRALHTLVHCLLCELARHEKSNTYRRMTNVSDS